MHAAVARDGDVRALDEFREEVEVDGAAVHLRGEAGVECDARAARRLGRVEQFEERHTVGARPRARLERHGEVGFALDGHEEIVHELWLGHEGRAVAFVADARHGAAGVEVKGDEPLECRCLASGEGEVVGVVSEDLARDGTFSGQHLEEVAGLRRPVRERGGADHLRVGEIGAEFVGDLAERGVREVRERCEDEFHLTLKGSPSSRYESVRGSSGSLVERGVYFTCTAFAGVPSPRRSTMRSPVAVNAAVSLPL